jgi:hypothetical protein
MAKGATILPYTNHTPNINTNQVWLFSIIALTRAGSYNNLGSIVLSIIKRSLLFIPPQSCDTTILALIMASWDALIEWRRFEFGFWKLLVVELWGGGWGWGKRGGYYYY